MNTLTRLMKPPSVGEEDMLPSIIRFSQLHLYWSILRIAQLSSGNLLFLPDGRKEEEIS